MPTRKLCLLARIRDGERSAERVANELFLPIVYRWCRRWGVPQKDAPRVVKRVFRDACQKFREQSAANQTFLSFLWGHARYHAAEHPRVQGMGIPDRYPDDVPATMIEDDGNRLHHSAANLLIQKFPQNEHVIFEHLFAKQQRASVVASETPFTLAKIREARNTVLRHIRGEFAEILKSV